MDQRQTSTKRLVRSKRERVIAGVCGGIAEYINTTTKKVEVSIHAGASSISLYWL